MYRKEKRSKNHDSPKTHSKINRIVLDRGRKYAYYAEQMETSFGRKNPVKKRNVERLAEEKKKRSEIMEISDTMARHKAIAENIPKEYFDYVYSVYGIGWTTDLQGTFNKIASYLKTDGIFIFSWHHTLNYCIAWSCDERKDVLVDNKFVLTKSYYDETYFKMPVHDSEIVLCNRKISTYINALAKAGFMVEQFIEETDSDSLKAAGDIDIKTQKAKMMPLSFCIKARKI